MANPDLERAHFALDCVRNRVPDGKRDKYLTELRKLPARLHTSGLGQAVAFYISAGASSPEAEICRWLEEWLRDKRKIYDDPKRELIHSITSDSSQDRYRRASVEARALAVWLKRFAEAFLETAHGVTNAPSVDSGRTAASGDRP